MVPGGGVLGWDMTAALALASALGIDLRAAAELLPDIEAEMVSAINRRNREGDDG